MKSTLSACSTWASTKWPMRALAITGMDTASTMPSIRSGSDMRATPPWARMSAGTRSSAMTATAPASSAMRACSALTTSMITPPFIMSARPRLTRVVPVPRAPSSAAEAVEAEKLRARSSLMVVLPKGWRPRPRGGWPGRRRGQL